MSTEKQHDAENFGVVYEEMTPVLLPIDIVGVHEIRLPYESNTDVPTKRSMVPVTKILLPANCRGGMDGNDQADFCKNMSFCRKCLDPGRIESTDLVQELAPIGPEILDISAYAEQLPKKEREKVYLSVLPTDVRKNMRFMPRAEAVKFAAAYVAIM